MECFSIFEISKVSFFCFGEGGNKHDGARSTGAQRPVSVFIYLLHLKRWEGIELDHFGEDCVCFPVVFFPKRRKVTEEPVAKVELFKLCSHQQLAALPLAGRLEGKERKKNFSKEEGGEEKGDCSSSCISGIPSLVGRVPTVSFPSVLGKREMLYKEEDGIKGR